MGAEGVSRETCESLRQKDSVKCMAESILLCENKAFLLKRQSAGFVPADFFHFKKSR